MKIYYKLYTTLLFTFFVSCIAIAQTTGKDIVIGKSFSINSKILNEERPYQIYLPSDYDFKGQPVSVLYLLDGERHFHHTTGIVSFLKKQGRIPNFMVVSISNTTDRTRDLTPTINLDMKALDQMPTAGGADKMLSFIKKELIPHIDKTYNTNSFKILTGHSLGGLFAVHTLINEPDLFDAYISISPSMWWDNQNLVNQVELFLAEKPKLECFFYMTMANEGGNMLGGAMKLAALFEEAEIYDFNWNLKIMKEETHNSIPHRSIYYGLEAIFKGWYFTDLQKLHSDRGMEGIKVHYSRASKKLGIEIMPNESEINNLGYELMQSGNIEKALEVFLENIRLYPNSYNAYDSAAEAYMKNKQYKLAIKNYKKSLSLNPKNKNGIAMLNKLGVYFDPTSSNN